ncbi:MAG: GtrA family protein [Acholeplasmatales bacterium]|nr:GtrA family protein [Acholeplasmatales bacterium]
MKQNRKELSLEILRFLIVGGLATLVDYLVTWVFKNYICQNLEVNLAVFIYTAAGFTAGLFTNWFLQKFVYRYITKDQQRSMFVFFKFVVLSLIGFGITWLGMRLSEPIHAKVLFDFWFLHDIQLWFWVFKVVLTIIVLIMNYIGRKLFVFNQKKNKESLDNEESIDEEKAKE